MEESNELTEFQSALTRCLFGTIEQRTISRKLIEKLLEEQLKQGQEVPVAAGWVDCKNSLPETEGEYLTYYKDNDTQTVQYFDGRVWGYLATVKPNVTHWTNLPPAPTCS